MNRVVRPFHNLWFRFVMNWSPWHLRYHGAVVEDELANSLAAREADWRDVRNLKEFIVALHAENAKIGKVNIELGEQLAKLREDGGYWRLKATVAETKISGVRQILGEYRATGTLIPVSQILRELDGGVRSAREVDTPPDE